MYIYQQIAVMKKKVYLIAIALLLLGYLGYRVQKHIINKDDKIGKAIDSLHGVKVYYNGSIDHVQGRNLSEDGYNLGLKYQCVEFVKRYYYEHYRHKMPDSYGHAKDFFNNNLEDGAFNTKRALIQYTNPSKSKPKEGDLLIYSGHVGNPYGHVAIVSEVGKDFVKIIQQNPGVSASSRAQYSLIQETKKWRIDNGRILGWLRKN